jgi:hypothetical protein
MCGFNEISEHNIPCCHTMTRTGYSGGVCCKNAACPLLGGCAFYDEKVVIVFMRTDKYC